MTNKSKVEAEALKYFWPHPFPQGQPPVEVTFSSGLPPEGKVFQMPFSLFIKALEASNKEARIEELRGLPVNKSRMIKSSDVSARITQLKDEFNA